MDVLIEETTGKTRPPSCPSECSHKHARTTEVPCCLVTPHHCPLVPEPSVKEVLQHKTWKKTKVTFLKNTYRKRSISEQDNVLTHLCVWVEWNHAPAAWVIRQIGGIDKNVDPDV